ncbi:MAG TPA: serine/threonine-protein kinase [Caldimonas sp.]
MSAMRPDLWARLEPRLDELLTLAPLERARRLDDIAANDPDTARELRALLSAGDDASRAGFLSKSVAPALLAMLAPTAAAGDVLGPWTLVEPIGEGGMGSVWRARRSDGRFEGAAAVKLLKTGLFDAAGQERFRREGAILARLRHPSIAQLLDAGITAKGQPYLILELVEGERIDHWCAARSPSIRERIELFQQVLAAVAAAHGQLVIHRDLKPSNILVDETGRAKLLDFGIARLLPGQDDAAETALTRAGALALTPQYAAPEQFEGGVLGMATDVFALGIVLYELLAKVHPSGLPAGSHSIEYLRAASDGRYKPASERAPGERRALRGDLDNILDKALAPLPAERYANVAAFADDLQRHLDDRPVAAQPGTLAHRAAKFVRRNRIAVAAATAVVAALAVGLAATLWMGAEASRQRDLALGEANRARQAEGEAIAFQSQTVAQAARADAQAAEALSQASRAREQAARAERESERASRSANEARLASAEAQNQRTRALAEAAQARQQAERAKAVQGFLIDLFASNTVGQAGPLAAQKLTARELLDRGAQRLDGALAAQPASQLEVTKALASIYGELVMPEAQLKFLRKQVALSESLHGPDAIETAAAYASLAVLLKLEDKTEGLQVAHRAERIYDARKEHSSIEYGTLQITLSELLNGTDLDAAERHARAALQVFAATPTDIHYGLAQTRLGMVMYFRGRLADAEATYQRAVANYEAAGDLANPLITATYANLGRIQEMRLEFDLAEASSRRAVEASQRINGPYHATTVVFRGSYAAGLAAMSRLPDALKVARENETALRSAPAEQQQRWLRNVQSVMGNIEAQYGLIDAAGQHLEAAAAAEKAANPVSRTTAEVALAAANAAIERGDAARASEHMATVQQYLDSAAAGAAAETRALARSVGAQLEAAHGRCGEALARLGPMSTARAYATQSEFRAALSEAELRAECNDSANADAMAAATLAAIDSRQLQRPLALVAAQAQVVRARAALARQDAAEAERYLQLALPVQAAQYDAASPTLADTRLLRARALAELGRPGPARELVEAARAALAQHAALAARHGRLLDETVRIAAAR